MKTVILMVALLTSCAAGTPKNALGCIKHVDQYGITYERVVVTGENPGNQWEYNVQFPDSNSPEIVYNVRKERVAFVGCPTVGKMYMGSFTEDPIVRQER